MGLAHGRSCDSQIVDPAGEEVGSTTKRASTDAQGIRRGCDKTIWIARGRLELTVDVGSNPDAVVGRHHLRPSVERNGAAPIQLHTGPLTV